jgi:hypothetical protein
LKAAQALIDVHDREYTTERYQDAILHPGYFSFAVDSMISQRPWWLLENERRCDNLSDERLFADRNVCERLKILSSFESLLSWGRCVAVEFQPSLALREHMLLGNRVSLLEAILVFGVQNLNAELTRLRKDGFLVKSERVSMAKILRRTNDLAECKPPANLPFVEIFMTEYWISRWNDSSPGGSEKPCKFLLEICVRFARGRFQQTSMLITWSHSRKVAGRLQKTGRLFAKNVTFRRVAPMSEIMLRDWQGKAIAKALKWLTETKIDRHFLINAAPGSGKTICASVIAKRLIETDEIDRVIVIAPRAEVVKQWGDEFRFVTGRHMTKVTGAALIRKW